MHSPHTRVFVFGNALVQNDALPLAMVPTLEKTFPEISFEMLDPNEEWDVPPHMYMIDTVVGIDRVTVFHDLSVFTNAPRVTCHDFDAYANVLLLKKLGIVKEVTILGIPEATRDIEATTEEVSALIRAHFPHIEICATTSPQA